MPDHEPDQRADQGADQELQQLAVDLLMCTARLIRLAGRRSGSDVPTALVRVLAQLDQLGSLRITELAAADRCSQPTMTNLVQRLAERGWVDRTPDADDARAVRVAINPAGARALAEQRTLAAAGLTPELRRLSPEQLRQLTEGLAVLRALLDPT